MSKAVDYKKARTPQRIRNQKTRTSRRLSLLIKDDRLNMTSNHPGRQSLSSSFPDNLERSLKTGKVQDKQTWLKFLDRLQKSPTFLNSMIKKSKNLSMTGNRSFRQRPSLYKAPFRMMNQLKPPLKIPELIVSVQDKSVHNPDWKYSQLELNVLEGNLKFNPRKDPSYLTYAQLRSEHFNSRESVQRGIKTIEKLKKELQMTGFPKYKHTAKSVLATCIQLFDVRAVTIDILASIHQREQLIESVFMAENTQLQTLFTRYQLISSKIASMISNWRDLNLPFDKFIYNSADYLVKIEEDTEYISNKLGFAQE